MKQTTRDGAPVPAEDGRLGAFVRLREWPEWAGTPRASAALAERLVRDAYPRRIAKRVEAIGSPHATLVVVSVGWLVWLLPALGHLILWGACRSLLKAALPPGVRLKVRVR